MKFEAKRSATDGDTVMHGVGIQRVAGLVALAALAVDQLTKWLAEQWLAGRRSGTVLQPSAATNRG